MQTEPEIKVTTDTSTQTTPATTVDAVMQTAPNDEPPRLLNDAGTSTETSSTCETGVQANETPTSPSLPQLAATSLLTTPTQPPSAPSTTPSSSSTATTTAPLASEHSPAARIRRQSLLAQPTTSQTSPQHHLLHPESPPAPATSQLPTPTPPATNPRETASKAVPTTHTATTTQETATHAPDSSRRRSTATATALRDDEQLCSSKRVVYPTDKLCRPPHRQRRHRTLPIPSSPPQLVPLAPIIHHEPTTTPHASTSSATSSTACASMMAVPPPLPHSGTQTTAPERRNMPPGVSQTPPDVSPPPGLPQTPRKRAVSASSVWYTSPASPTTPSTPFAPRSPPVCPSPPQPSPKRAGSPLHTRLDWAEDAECLPTTPLPPRDFSCLRATRAQPFRNLRQRTRRRRPPAQFSTPSRPFARASPAPHVYPSYSQVFITRSHPTGIGPGKPVITVPFGAGAPTPAPPVPNLDWERDPRLVNLSRALRALGWTPPC